MKPARAGAAPSVVPRSMRFGTPDPTPALDFTDLLAAPTAAALRPTDVASDDVPVAAIDPGLADTAAFWR